VDNGNRQPLHPVRIVSVPWGDLLTVRFLAGIKGLVTHYQGKRSVACLGEKDCPPTTHRLKPVHKFYGPCETWDGLRHVWRPGVLEVTEHLEEQLRHRELRGEVWLLDRTGKSMRQSLVTGLFCERLPEEQVSQAFDIVPVLQRFYRVTTLLLGVPSPLPARLLLSDVAGPAPRLPEQLSPQAQAEPTPEQWEQFRRRIDSNPRAYGMPNGKKV
jgi:hypothetical protein